MSSMGAHRVQPQIQLTFKKCSFVAKNHRKGNPFLQRTLTFSQACLPQQHLEKSF